MYKTSRPGLDGFNLKLVLSILFLIFSLALILFSGNDLLELFLPTEQTYTFERGSTWTDAQQAIMDLTGVDESWYLWEESHHEFVGMIYKFLYGNGSGMPSLLINALSFYLVSLFYGLVSRIFHIDREELTGPSGSLFTDLLFSAATVALSVSVFFRVAQWIYSLVATILIFLLKIIVLPDILNYLLSIVLLSAFLGVFFYYILYKEIAVSGVLIMKLANRWVKPGFSMLARIVYMILMIALYWFLSTYWDNIVDRSKAKGTQRLRLIVLLGVVAVLALAPSSFALCLLYKGFAAANYFLVAFGVACAVWSVRAWSIIIGRMVK